MADSRAAEILDRLLDPLGQAITPDVARSLIALRANEEVQTRIDLLADRNSEGVITADERDEYEALISANELIAVLQAKARAILSGNSAA